ncbi:MAG: MarR family transcriptional regulator [Syntrophomonadaceae bacterium]|jgi:DNA-binding MarR family transcriptional regulator|nr:MarR family transcriptional regulator [Syntrophomonadaceae bacterium]
MLDSGAELQEILLRLGRKLLSVDKFDAACCGMTVGQCRMLQEIGKHSHISIKQLAENFKLDKSTVSRIVDSLVKEGWVVRRPDTMDRRCLVLNLSQRGEETLYNLTTQISNYYQSVLEAIPALQRDQLIESLELLLKALDKVYLESNKTIVCC